MRIAAITSGKNTPSTRFRIRQHISFLSENGISVEEYYPWIDKTAGLPTKITDTFPKFTYPFLEFTWQQLKITSRLPGILKSWKYDATWLGRELLPGRYTLERFLHRPIVFDVDDAIWQAKPDGINTISRIAKEAELIIAGNSYIADWMSQFNNNIVVIPTGVNLDKFQLKDHKYKNYDKDPFIIGWSGSAGNYVYLYNIENALHEFLSQHDAKLLIIAERPPAFKKINPDLIEFIPWSPKSEASALLMMDVGLMPLPNTDWTRGKCAFKMLQYMACGLPVIVSPVGINKEILNMSPVGFGAETNMDFVNYLIYLYNNQDATRTLGLNGRKIAAEHFSTEVIGRKLVSVFHKIN